MIDHDKKIIYVDHSSLSTFRSCHEKARLGYEEGWRPKVKTVRDAPLDFGHAFHAGVAAGYDYMAGGFHDANGWTKFVDAPPRSGDMLTEVRLAFLRDLKVEGAVIPLELTGDERRSVERGVYLLMAYFERWKDEPFDNVVNPDTGEPYTEIGFSYYLMDFNGYTVMYVGRIDRIMLNRSTGRKVLWEFKTTTQALPIFIRQVKPNHQITGYFLPVRETMPDIVECCWDAVFVSSRQPDLKKAMTDRWWAFGIDISKDFARQFTNRSHNDLDEFTFDTIETVKEYCSWLFRTDVKRWSRNAPGACHTYGGCTYRDICPMNHAGGLARLESDFVRVPWEPYKLGVTSAEKEP